MTDAEENELLRKLLWKNHGCEVIQLYQEGWEMRCNICMCDFKHWEATQLETWMLWNPARKRDEPSHAQLVSYREALKAFVSLRMVGKFLSSGDFLVDGESYLAAQKKAEEMGV